MLTANITGSATGASTVQLNDHGTGYYNANATWTVPAALADGNWHQVVVTYAGTGANNTATLYVDGVSAGSQGLGRYELLTAGTTLLVGGNVVGTATIHSFTGSLDELSIYPSVLSTWPKRRTIEKELSSEAPPAVSNTTSKP